MFDFLVFVIHSRTPVWETWSQQTRVC